MTVANEGCNLCYFPSIQNRELLSLFRDGCARRCPMCIG